MMIRKRTLVALLLVVLFGIGFFTARYIHQHQVKIGEHTIWLNPNAKIDPKKIYTLRLWDYDWPLGKGMYQAYMQGMLADFNKVYPNIRVELTLLDLLSGPEQIQKALQSGKTPDVYCSAFQIPKFDVARQIPFGPFLTRDERTGYFPKLLELGKAEQTIGFLPRWTAPGVWVGNKKLLEQLGFNIPTIQKHGWSWIELNQALHKAAAAHLPMRLVGNLGYSGLPSQFIYNCGRTIPETGIGWDSGEIGTVLDFLADWKQQKLLPANMEGNMIGQFLNGQALALTGVRPVIYRYVKQRLAGVAGAFEPVLLPVPAQNPAKSVLLTENGVVAVYRHSGDEHVAAAILLAKYISTYAKTGPMQQMMLFPASRIAAANWAHELVPVLGDVKVLGNWLNQSNVVNLEEIPGFQTKFYPVLKDFCDGKISKDEALQKVSGR